MYQECYKGDENNVKLALLDDIPSEPQQSLPMIVRNVISTHRDG